MARPREFDEDTAITGAMDVFWLHGYEGASLPDLLAGMKLTRGSLYKAFTDKKTLFLIALKRYEADAVQPAVACLTNAEEPNGVTRINRIFHGILHKAQQGDWRGCMLCSAAAGPAAYDRDIAAEVHRLIEQMRAGFAVALAASPRHANLTPVARQDLSALLMTHYTGLRILTRARAPLAELGAGVRALDSILGVRNCDGL